MCGERCCKTILCCSSLVSRVLVFSCSVFVLYKGEHDHASGSRYVWWRAVCRQVYNKFLNTVGCPVTAGRRVYTKGELFKPWW
ncbi:hypothetical protein FIBSPDRAFT_557836 [Athelia psychrophila]|uniref:Uncharacterized protein n=1 Tax=Athelia psychrophila TaxID=1759441 RepID=A0A166IEF0_9AGAM|nr:hypothetical protein FIBSPDRAFT_557836 [Fibularhizoctonia sp. CBS 109695]